MGWKIRNMILHCMSMIYLMAFGSIYCQSPGLYGDNGILPLRLVAAPESKSFREVLVSKRPFVSLGVLFGLTAPQFFDLLCLTGIFLSIMSIIVPSICNSITFILLWTFYYSLYQVGQTFMWFQWDILLLETGILCIILSFFRSNDKDEPHDRVGIFMFRWLLFRLMFMSGIVKLTSECPTWWGLTALDWHYESQCIPTPLAWYFHQLPSWFQRLSVVATFLIEIPVPFLFFSPVRSMRIFAFCTQLLLQVLIILTGNYNFFNLLTITLCLSLLDDKYSSEVVKSDGNGITAIGTWISRKASNTFKFLFSVMVYGGLAFGLVKYFDLRLNTQLKEVKSQIVFSKEEFYDFIGKAVPFSIVIGLLLLIWNSFTAVCSCFQVSGKLARLWSLFTCVGVITASASIFLVSLVPYTTIDRSSHSRLPRQVRSAYQVVNDYSIVNSYGLFRSMTGVGGRPEVVIEGSESTNSGWKEYEFLYKPGNVSRKLPFVAPHQPRLDWQMWFAALGSYEHNPWFINLVYRLLTNEPDVIELLEHNPFPVHPPKYIRATRYVYHYTRWSPGKKQDTGWWKREYSHEYLPIVSLDNHGLIEYLRGSGILRRKPKQVSRNALNRLVVNIRSYLGQPEGFYFVSALLVTSVLMKAGYAAL